MQYLRQQGHDELSRPSHLSTISMFWLFRLGEGEGVRVNPNIVSVRIVMHIGIFWQSLISLWHCSFKLVIGTLVDTLFRLICHLISDKLVSNSDSQHPWFETPLFLYSLHSECFCITVVMLHVDPVIPSWAVWRRWVHLAGNTFTPSCVGSYAFPWYRHSGTRNIGFTSHSKEDWGNRCKWPWLGPAVCDR
jgi:hypothetical protein